MGQCGADFGTIGMRAQRGWRAGMVPAARREVLDRIKHLRTPQVSLREASRVGCRALILWVGVLEKRAGLWPCTSLSKIFSHNRARQQNVPSDSSRRHRERENY
jgi:hypothetical protein